ncbi:MarR family winged helix-turn-helix transcriptional regulator [Alteromonas lipolytica]|uniref:MarR family transcriptional regulator n=1 Tax=Alteromonas lipolytica TaxID=1856405 RepID=A0A1E8FER4_9ALTE|nr:MarR family winged helix-turn-helix transcriptional regulator [Alteromonas lipolytica]OFI33973.1 MarR family transcriptional regulator [Alteromonas lipolytica]GGF66771.1 transcriptional regulator [Alteromonas lipolytica]
MPEEKSTHHLRLDLERYVPGLITFLANKLSASASNLYRKEFGVGIVEWRIMALLAVEQNITANYICSVIGLDKALVSRTVKQMKSSGFITLEKSSTDSRYSLIALTKEGIKLHNDIIKVALAREKRLLEVLSDDESDMLINLLQKLNKQVGALK